MSFNTTYGLLFEITLFHNYFLNNGKDAYTGMSTDDQKKMLQKFDSDSFTTIIPTIETNTQLKNYKMILKKTKMGFRVYIKSKEGIENESFIKTPLDLKLDFIITINDYQFENYTDLEFTLNRMFLFSNVKPLSEPVDFKYIPDINDNILISNDYLVSEKTTIDLISKLQPLEKQGVFGLVSLTLKGDNSQDIIASSGKMLSPSFKINFDNRKTLWKYINRKTGTEIVTILPKPLTYSGFVEINPTNDFDPSQNEANQYPNPSVKSITKISGNYCSEIFI
ncbi:hypothetical protein OIU83_22050 [Flavobacterium sp. LS1R49]|uniref:Uncharacterized protein n=1 Tax=Flavobacterium shii TaxID=2987687 RepID=A0A9X3C861_9FLAO|nr:hypothetical protein [Flavobacterium shii]MCV9930358.1 hypothetical protein [Flavobacterium shii]